MKNKLIKLVIIITLCLSNNVSAQEADTLNTVRFVNELNTIKSTLVAGDNTIVIPFETINQTLFDSFQLCTPYFVMNNEDQNIFLKRFSDMTATGVEYIKNTDTIVQHHPPFSDTAWEDISIQSTYKCKKYFFSNITNASLSESNAFLWHIQQKTTLKIDRLDTIYLITEYFSVVDTGNKVSSSTRYIVQGDYYDQAENKLFGTLNLFKVNEKDVVYFALGKEKTLGKFSIFPNPTSNIFYVYYTPNYDNNNFKLEVIDATGHLIQSIDAPKELKKQIEYKFSHTLNFESSGTYFIRIGNERESITERINLIK